jgi:glyoxylase-like metal-dependent hydrolase (beta-lactamase superfamily II)
VTVTAVSDGSASTTELSVDGDIAWGVSGGKVQRLEELAQNNRVMNYYHHPLALVQAALNGPADLAARARAENGDPVIEISVGRNRYAMHIDSKTKLPTKIVSTAYNVTLGDVEYSTSFSDYAQVEALRLPRKMEIHLDRWPYNSVSVRTVLGAQVDLPAAPDEVRQPASAAPEPVFVEPLAAGVWLLGATPIHSVLIEFPSYAMLVEAPESESRTSAFIARARTLAAGKPLRYVVNTHHHYDHSAGLRAAVAEGATVVTHESNRNFVEQLVSRPRVLALDRLSKNPRKLSLISVKADDTFELRDGPRAVEVFRSVNDTHSDGNLLVYLRAERMLVEADVFAQGLASPDASNLLKDIAQRRLTVDRVVSLHGGVVRLSELSHVQSPVE